MLVSENNERKKKIDSLIINLITTDLQPLFIVEDSAFTGYRKYALSHPIKNCTCVLTHNGHFCTLRVFSKAGNIIDKKRNWLKPSIVNEILFLNSCKFNYE